MSRLTLLHRDLSRRIESLKQIVESSNGAAAQRVPPPASASTASSSGAGTPHPHPFTSSRGQHRGNVGDMHSIDLNPNTNQLIIRCTHRKTPTTTKSSSTTPNSASINQKNKGIPLAQRGESLDEGFESDVDTISLVSTESTISLLNHLTTRVTTRETDSANGSASSDSDDSDGNKQYSSLESGTLQTDTSQLQETENKIFKALDTSEDTETITEYFNLVNCVCYTDSNHPEVLILLVSTAKQEEETLIFKFENPKELEAFHENFSTVKAVANQKTSPFASKPFNLLQRTDSNGMTHIRISRPDQESSSSGNNEEDFTSLLSLPSFPTEKGPVHKYEKFATMGKPRKRILKKSKSIEDLLDPHQAGDLIIERNLPLKKIWSAENLLQLTSENLEKPKVPPRKGRKKGQAPLPPNTPSQEVSISDSDKILRSEMLSVPEFKSNSNFSQSFPSLHPVNDKNDNLGLGNVLQGQFVRVQVDQQKSHSTIFPLMNFRQKTGPEIIKYENVETWRTKPQKVRNFDAFKFSDPKNLTGYQLQKDLQNDLARKPIASEKKKPKGFSALMLYIPMYKSAKKLQNLPPAPTGPQGYAGQQGPFPGHVLGPSSGYPPSPGTFTNRLFGMSSKLKEFGSLQSGCNPNKRYDNQNYPPRTPMQHISGNPGISGNASAYGRPENPYASYNKEHSKPMPSFNPSQHLNQESTGRFLGRLGKFGRSGSLGNLTILSQNEKIQSNTLKSVIKKKSKDEDGRKFGRHGKKVTFSAYNTVQVV